jgi:hypothetical protein
MGHTDMLNLTPDGGHPPFPHQIPSPPLTRGVQDEDPPGGELHMYSVNEKYSVNKNEATIPPLISMFKLNVSRVCVSHLARFKEACWPQRPLPLPLPLQIGQI